MTAAGRATSTGAAAAPAAAAAGNRAAFGGSKEDGYGAVGVLSEAILADDGFVGVFHGTKGIKMIATIFAYVLIKRHSNLSVV